MVTYQRTFIPDAATRSDESAGLWKLSVSFWILLGAAFCIILVVFNDGFSHMVEKWANQEEYSHGFLLPLISVFLIRQKADRLRKSEFTGSWLGFAVVVLSLLLFVLGELSSLYIIIEYAFLVAIAGFVLATTGAKAFKHLWVALFFLLFMIPLPNFLYNNLSLKLQLWSSALGVEFIRFCDISVYLEGNVIDLGHYQLQVVDACSGLRYLFPFMSLSFLCAYVYKAAFWKRSLIFLSSLPITIFMNSFRIGVIGVLVEYFGQSAAEGFIHYFEGWVIFMVCLAILLLEMRVLAQIGSNPKDFSEVFDFTLPTLARPDSQFRERRIPLPTVASLILLTLSMGLPFLLAQSTEVVPNRKTFAEFPLKIGPWHGQTEIMEQQYLDTLELDDYLLADFQGSSGQRVNYYIGYYASQSKGHSIHSPRSCLPGGGWVVNELPEIQIASGNRSVEVARVLIQKGDVRQLVYFWTQQRGRIINNEYLIKWYLFYDALTKQRSDGALVRLTTQLGRTEDVAQANERLQAFAELSNARLAEFVPN